MDYRSPAGYDRTRNAVIGHKDFDLTYLEEAFTSEHWLVRGYRLTTFPINTFLNLISMFRVKKPDEFNRPRIEPKDRLIPRKKSFSSKKVNNLLISLLLLTVTFQSNKRKRGVIKSRPVVVKGHRA